MLDVTATLQQILANHGIETAPNEEGWISSNGSYPACRATTNEPQFRNGGYTLRLDVEIALPEDRLIVESFSNFGADPNQAFQYALHDFCAGTLHVLLSALWGVGDHSQVFVEKYTNDGLPWTLHLGNMVHKAADGEDVQPPNDLIPIFDEAILHLQSDPRVHWGRLFYANMPNRDRIVELLLDNQPSPIAQERLAAASWATSEFFYSQRMFWVLTPDQAA